MTIGNGKAPGRDDVRECRQSRTVQGDPKQGKPLIKLPICLHSPLPYMEPFGVTRCRWAAKAKRVHSPRTLAVGSSGGLGGQGRNQLLPRFPGGSIPLFRIPAEARSDARNSISPPA